MIRTVLITAMLVSIATAQQTNQPAEPPKKARISGSVVSSKGAPIPRAQVRLNGPPVLNDPSAVNMSATADDAGKFVIENIEPGRNYQLTAQRPGFVAARYGARTATAPGSPLTLDAGADLKSLIITMTPQGVISGRVTDQTGDPVQGAIVAVLRRGYQRGVRQLVNATTAQSNDQGEFRVANLSPGRYYVMASDRRLLDALSGAPTPEGGRTGNIATYYPNAPDAQAAAPLDVAAGVELRSIDIRFLNGRMFTARGKVDTAGLSPTSVILTAMPKDSASNGSLIAQLSQSTAQTRPPDYTFELRNLAPGTYLVQTRTQNLVNGVQSLRAGNFVEMNVTDADLKGLVIPMAAGTPIKGTVTLEGGDLKTLFPANSQNNAATAIAAANAGILVSGLRPAIGLTQVIGLPTPAASGPIEENGTFTLDGVAPGKYQLNVAALPQGFFVKAARFAGREVLHAGLELGAGGGGDLAIVLSNKPGEIDGAIVTDSNESHAGYLVTLWTKNPEPGSANGGVRTAYTDQNGGFQFRNLPPGEYFTVAWEEADAQLVLSRDFLAQFSGEASSVTISEGGQGSAQVKLISGEKSRAAEAKLP